MFEAQVALIGLGEAGQAFAAAMSVPRVAFDRKTDNASTRQQKEQEARAIDTALATSNRDATLGAAAVLSLVTADQAGAAADETAFHISAGSLFFDFNSVAPGTKRAASRTIEAAGARYIDVAVMSPVLPARLRVPLLIRRARGISGCAGPREHRIRKRSNYFGQDRGRVVDQDDPFGHGQRAGGV